MMCDSRNHMSKLVWWFCWPINDVILIFSSILITGMQASWERPKVLWFPVQYQACQIHNSAFSGKANLAIDSSLSIALFMVLFSFFFILIPLFSMSVGTCIVLPLCILGASWLCELTYVWFIFFVHIQTYRCVRLVFLPFFELFRLVLRHSDITFCSAFIFILHLLYGQKQII